MMELDGNLIILFVMVIVALLVQLFWISTLDKRLDRLIVLLEHLPGRPHPAHKPDPDEGKPIASVTFTGKME